MLLLYFFFVEIKTDLLQILVSVGFCSLVCMVRANGLDNEEDMNPTRSGAYSRNTLVRTCAMSMCSV